MRTTRWDQSLIDRFSRGIHRGTAMKHILKPFRICSAIALLALATGCATTQTTNTDLFATAGFKLVNADTPEKQTLLKSLPAGQISVIKWKGKTFYVEPAAAPNQAYVGTEKE